MVRILDAYGSDVVIVETVGVGQDELEITRTAHSTLVVMAPGMGDEVQAIKAGILETADVFAVNKADRDGADSTMRDLELMIALGSETMVAMGKSRGHTVHGGEKVDVIPWNEDASVFVANALSPAQVLGVVIDEEHRIATVTVPERMLSLAIGREGQNARLAARLTGWRIDIRSDTRPVAAPVADDGADVPDPAADGSVAPDVEVVEPSGTAAPAAAEIAGTAAPAAAVEVPAVVPAAPAEASVDAPVAPAKRSRKKAPEEVSS